ncbi:hypothetical protein [Psychrobacter pygoscelis]|uniref:hypothetical protein n=1 Tax=Psychrobacter pygoscelis TaxID=2488563 RepID=UPI0013F3DDE9|nr:hypothetical protein [Psychrobacter pygoscelis]
MTEVGVSLCEQGYKEVFITVLSLANHGLTGAGLCVFSAKVPYAAQQCKQV